MRQDPEDLVTKLFDWIASWYNEYWAWGFCLFACVGLPLIFWITGPWK